MFALFNLRASSKVAPLRRLHTATAPRFNIAFDIDGVLIKGKQVIPQTRRALELLQENKIPYVFLTNGGGMPESEKAEQLTKKLGLYVNPEHLIVSHSPMKSLVPKYKDANVLVVGGEGSACKHAAHVYGFKNVVTPEEIHSVHPSICPISICETRAVPWTEGLENVNKPVDAVMVFHDSNDWGRDLQICLDALVSKGGKLGTIKRSDELHSTKQTVPIYFSNPDIVWANEFPVNRFGQGTFRVCLEKIYENLTGQPLDYITYGKPMKTTYEYAESLLDKIDPLPEGPDGQPTKRTVYAVGDNPYADIAGANGYGWNSVLVRTGVFKPKGDENHHVHPATIVVDHVGDAVNWIIARENMKK
ncbi:hypothetical protein BGZ95_004897 [Linnemannia exigua]|uniref:HAD-superfamily hydrolase n=1 Tax=Linnemannia exigua TaxID=604196 RepID=A0AAD4H1V5_9FUNG|nr:hypothetical protein BGZ95_004897 [Linnemannia exigua]